MHTHSIPWAVAVETKIDAQALDWKTEALVLATAYMYSYNVIRIK